jgi:hypothetical protein
MDPGLKKLSGVGSLAAATFLFSSRGPEEKSSTFFFTFLRHLKHLCIQTLQFQHADVVGDFCRSRIPPGVDDYCRDITGLFAEKEYFIKSIMTLSVGVS